MDTAASEADPPTINVRIAGGDIIQDVFLSPVGERPPLVQESYQTRPDSDEREVTHPFSLRPPPHLLRSRKASRTVQQNLTEPVTVEKTETRSQASSRNSSSSAVSPRFMALRKLSESGTVSPGDPVFFAWPLPLKIDPRNKPAGSFEKPTNDDPGFEQRLLEKISDLIENRLQTTISQIMLQATENQREAQKFWEEQKQELMEMGTSFLSKLDGFTTPETSSSIRSDSQELETLRKQQIELENELNGFRRKQIELQRQLFDMELLRAHNSELEKQLEQERRQNSEREQKNEQRIRELESRVAQLSQKVKENRSNTDWADAVAAAEQEAKVKDQMVKRIADLEQENKRLQQAESVTKIQLEQLQRELKSSKQRKQQRHSVTAGPTNTTTTTTPTPTTPTTTTTASNNSNNKERKASHRQSYFMNEEGHLTFTTEINGRLSQYTVKIPGAASSSSKRASTPAMTRTHTNNSSSTHSKLNVNAKPWKASSSVEK